MTDDPRRYDHFWLVDRSRVQLGRIGCRRARYREYHSGPNGYGIRHRAQSLPLVTGNQVHGLLAYFLMNPKAPDVEARAAITEAAAKYRRRCESRGYLEVVIDEGQREELQRVVNEQTALVEAMGWALYLYWIPALLEEWDVVAVEQELELLLADDTLLMNRPDVILRRKIDGTLAQYEAKTVGGWLHLPAWRRQWEDSAQLMLTRLAVEAQLKQKVSFAYVFAMDKGKRSKEEPTGLVKQWTFFLYAYHREANPPFVEEDWQLRWDYMGEDGKRHTLGKTYRRTPTWTFAFPGKPAEMSTMEYWMRSLPPEEVIGQREILGPFTFLEHSQESIVTGLVAEEREWREKLWAIYEVGERVGWDESNPEFIEALDTYAPQSWQCHPFGKDCQFLPICRREPGWEAPHEDERFELRRPHHQAELDQMKARGIEPPAEQDEEDLEPT